MCGKEKKVYENLKESIFLSIITTCKTCFTWENKAEIVLAVIAVAVVWWCFLTWTEGLKTKFKTRRKRKLNSQRN